MRKNLALALVSALLPVGVLEAGVRLARLRVNDFLNGVRIFGMFVEWDQDGQYDRGVPGARFTANGIEYAFNSLGVRGPEPPATKPPGTVRVVALGDSVTAGAGVPYADSYPSVLGARLASHGVQAVPASMGGWNTVEELHFLRHNVDRLAPDVVALLYVMNDADRLSPWETAERAPAGVWGRLYRTLVVHSRLFEWGAWVYAAKLKPTDWAGLRAMRKRKQEAAAAGPLFAPSQPGWLESRQALAEILAVCREHGAALVIYGWNLGSYPPGPTMVERLREFGAEHDVPVFDTAQLYTDQPAWTFWVLPFVDNHPNASANRRLGSFVGKTLDDLGLLGRHG